MSNLKQTCQSSYIKCHKWGMFQEVSFTYNQFLFVFQQISLQYCMFSHCLKCFATSFMKIQNCFNTTFPDLCLKYISCSQKHNIIVITYIATYLVQVMVANCNEIPLLCKVYEGLVLMIFNIIILHD